MPLLTELCIGLERLSTKISPAGTVALCMILLSCSGPWRDGGGCIRGGEGDADEVLAVVHVGAAIGEGGMAPQHVASARAFDRGQQPGAADFLVVLRVELREDEFALIIP